MQMAYAVLQFRSYLVVFQIIYVPLVGFILQNNQP